MKLSDYIKNLENILESHGDNELNFQVKDYYSRYGESAITTLSTEKNTMWDGVLSREGQTTLTLHLTQSEGKNPKITFRK